MTSSTPDSNKSGCSISLFSMMKIWKSSLITVILIIILGTATLPSSLGCGILAVSISCCVHIPHRLPKGLLYEVGIADLIVREQITQFLPKLNQYWWHSITDKLILGGIPLLNFDHITRMKKLGVQAVYSILEDFEAASSTFFSVPVIADHWKRAGIAYQRLRCPDMKAMTIKELSQAADWLHSHISSDETVYVHCKAGRGRSVMVAMAYLIRYHKKTLQQAMEHICSKRSVVSLRPCQLDRLKEFALYHL